MSSESTELIKKIQEDLTPLKINFVRKIQIFILIKIYFYKK